MSDFCVRCTMYIGAAKEIGEPQIFGTPDGYDLCSTCFHEEDAEIEREGTNDLPDRLAQYRDNFQRYG